MPAPKRPVGKPLPSKPGPATPPPSEEEEQKHSAPTLSSKADAFNNAAPETGINIPPGQYPAYIVGMTKEVDGEKESVKTSYEVAEGEHEGKVVNAWYGLFDKEGNAQRGAGFLKRDFELLGQPPLDYDNLEDQLEALVSERPLVNITVKQNGQWTNIYLQGLAE